METNELRRLNLVMVDGKMYQVFSLDPCFVGLSEVGKDELCDSVDVMRVEPVELTEDLLKKSNLKECKVVGTNMRMQTSFSIGSFYIIDGGEYKSILWSISFGGSVIKTYQSALFVHKLQNLCQSLTYQELEIKL